MILKVSIFCEKKSHLTECALNFLSAFKNAARFIIRRNRNNNRRLHYIFYLEVNAIFSIALKRNLGAIENIIC